MKLYLDDNLNAPALAGLLQKAGHSVVCPRDVGLTGVSDPRHLAHAVRQSLALVTKDVEDFTDLHHLITACGGSHPGIVLVFDDQDPKHDMKPKHIIAALGKLERSGFVIANALIELNHWR